LIDAKDLITKLVQKPKKEHEIQNAENEVQIEVHHEVHHEKNNFNAVKLTSLVLYSLYTIAGLINYFTLQI
jgi:hypothetical protein